MSDTIFALSSGAVPSGVAVVRVSGPATMATVEALCGDVPPIRKAAVRNLVHPESGAWIDEALVLVFRGPSSFTGEDVAEFQCHGSRAVIAELLEVLSERKGCRPAEPGEFTRRAFENGRLDLTEVEGLSDLIAAETRVQKQQALRQMGGSLGKLYDVWRSELIHMRAMIEAEFDFADEEDVPGSVADAVWEEAAGLAVRIREHLAQSVNGERLRTGLQVVLMGAPNAGKSSLLNAIAGRDAAIVTEEAGTTRDIIEVHLDLGGYPVTLVDTAGIREAAGVVEREGIRRAEERGRQADLILWTVEPDGHSASETDETVLAEDLNGAGVPLWAVNTKSDFGTLPKRDSSGTIPEIATSVKIKGGTDALIKALTRFAEETISVGEAPLATRQRHRHLLNECLEALHRAVSGKALPSELRAEELRSASDALGKITGRIDVEDLLDVIFRDFCIGK